MVSLGGRVYKTSSTSLKNIAKEENQSLQNDKIIYLIYFT
jgi:hypothetical protein